MAYDVRYQIFFKNAQQDNYRVDILEKDYSGDIKELIAGDSPFKLKYQSGDDSIINAIRASEAVIDFWSDEVTDLHSFYSEDDEKYRIDLYNESVLIANDITLFYEDQAATVVTILNEFNYNIGTNNTDFGIVPGMFVKYLDIFYEITNVIIEPVGGGNYNLEIIVATDPPHDTHTGIEIWQNPDITMNKLLWSGYLVQDNCQEEFQDSPFIVTLNATDNLALGKEIAFDVAAATFFPDNLISKITLFDYIKVILTATGLALPLRIYANIFENTQDDRSDDPANEFFSQTRLFSGMFLNEDGTWQDCYSILEKILSPLNAELNQADGCWNICRKGEAYLFLDNQIAGTEYAANFENPTAINLDPNFTVQHSTPLVPFDHEFLGADAIRRIERPFKFIKNTFNYEQPKQLIVGSDLQKLGAFIGSFIDGDLRYDDYEIPADWKHEDSDPNDTTDDASFIRVVTDTIIDTEVDRYIYTPQIGYGYKWLQFNPIEVSEGDSFDFSLQFKTFNDSTDNYNFHVRFLIITEDGFMYALEKFTPPGGEPYLRWNKSLSGGAAFYKTRTGIIKLVDQSTEYITWSLSEFTLDLTKPILPPIKQDGILLIGIAGANQTNGSFPMVDTVWNSIKLTFTNTINESTKVIGQTHTTSQTENIKNNFDEEINIDDSPRNVIAGTLFTNQLTTFLANIGDIYFTKTQYWHRLQLSEELRLGEITTFERKLLSFKPRTIIEGTFTGLRYSKDGVIRFLTPLNIIQIASLSDLHFVFGPCEFDYMSATWSATLWELYENEDSSDSFSHSYLFKYLYQTS